MTEETERTGSGWPATRWLAAAWLRRRWVAMVPAILIVAIGTTGTVVALTTAHRTSDAYRAYLDRADVGDVVINPSTNTREIEEAIRTLPGVEQVTSDALFFVTNDDGAPRSRAELGEGGSEVVVRGSPDGRYADMDRPAVQSGRLPTGPSEAAVSVEMAEALDLAVGDVEPLAFWRAVPDLAEGARIAALLDEVAEPIGVEDVTIVGIVAMPDGVLPDELYPRHTVILSPDVAARYDCVPTTPPSQSSFDVLMATMFPADCATQYRYYSLSLAGGAAAVKPALEEFLRRSNLLSGQLGDSVDLEDAGLDEPPSYFAITQETQPELLRVERAVRPTVIGLLVLGSAVAVAMLGLFALAVSRELRRTTSDRRQWHQLGVASAARAFVVGLPPALGAVVGVAAGIAASSLLAVGPLGLVAVVEAESGRRLDILTLGIAIALLVPTLALVAALVMRAARRQDPPPAVVDWPGRRLATRVASPAVAAGLRTAFGSRAAIPLIAGGILLTAGFVATAVFGTSLAALVSTPRSYGWPWEVAATTGGGYGDLDVAAAGELLDDDPAVDSWTVLGFVNEISLDGDPMMTMLGFEQTADLDLPVLEGALPTARDEVALGASTAAERGLAVGETVEIGGLVGPTEATITGIVVFPSLGPLFAERVGTGTGLLMPEAMHTEGQPDASSYGAATFVGVDLHPEADTPATRERIGDGLAGLDLLGFPAIPYSAPVRPPEIIDAGSTRTVPVVVAAVLAAMAAVGLIFATWSSTRARRKELAVLRSLGFVDAQVRGSVLVHSLATTLAALVVGIPLGVVAGRLSWRAFAGQLGVLSDSASTWLPVLIAVAGGILIALVAALPPAQLAPRTMPADALRAE